MRYSGPWAVENTIVLILVGIVVSILVGKKTSWLFGGLCAWILASAFWVYALPDYAPYKVIAQSYVDLLDSMATGALVQALLMGIAVFAVKVETQHLAFQVIALVNAVLIMSHGLFFQDTGILFNPSMSGCFQAALLPLFITDKKGWAPWGFILVLISALWTRQSQPIAGVFLVLGLFVISKKQWKTLLAAGVFSVCIGYLLTGDTLFSSDGRTVVWKTVMKEWALSINPITGAGTGTYPLWGIMITSEFAQKWTFLHSDWLQILFEQGIVGIVLALACYVQLLMKARVQREKFFVALIFGAWMCANMPWRFPLAALYGVFVIRWIFDETRKETRIPDSSCQESQQLIFPLPDKSC